MRRGLIDVMMLLMLCGAGLRAEGAGQKTDAPEVKDSLFVTQALHQAPQGAGTLHFARLLMGRPYVAHTLERQGEERLIVNTRQLDCTTLVENVVALTLCHQHGERSYAQFKRRLQALRYRQGHLEGYASRLHYFTDWIMDNERMGLVVEVGHEGAPFTAKQLLAIDYMSTHADSYQALKVHPQLVPLIAEQERRLTGLTFRYIPKAGVTNTKLLRQWIHDGDILAITCNKPGLDIAHLGFAVWQKDGLHLLNASQIHHRVVLEPMTLRQYLARHRSHTGIRVVRVRNKTT